MEARKSVVAWDLMSAMAGGKNWVVVFEVWIKVEGRWWGSRLGFLQI